MSEAWSPSGPPLAPETQPELVIHPSLGSAFDLALPAQIARLTAELPEPSSLTPGAWIAVSPGRSAATGALSRLFSRRARPLLLSVRCSALLLRGYVDVCADESETAFGRRQD
jgi:hypothetical protein